METGGCLSKGSNKLCLPFKAGSSIEILEVNGHSTSHGNQSEIDTEMCWYNPLDIVPPFDVLQCALLQGKNRTMLPMRPYGKPWPWLSPLCSYQFLLLVGINLKQITLHIFKMARWTSLLQDSLLQDQTNPRIKRICLSWLYIHKLRPFLSPRDNHSPPYYTM